MVLLLMRLVALSVAYRRMIKNTTVYVGEGSDNLWYKTNPRKVKRFNKDRSNSVNHVLLLRSPINTAWPNFSSFSHLCLTSCPRPPNLPTVYSSIRETHWIFNSILWINLSFLQIFSHKIGSSQEISPCFFFTVIDWMDAIFIMSQNWRNSLKSIFCFLYIKTINTLNYNQSNYVTLLFTVNI